MSRESLQTRLSALEHEVEGLTDRRTSSADMVGRGGTFPAGKPALEVRVQVLEEDVDRLLKAARSLRGIQRPYGIDEPAQIVVKGLDRVEAATSHRKQTLCGVIEIPIQKLVGHETLTAETISRCLEQLRESINEEVSREVAAWRELGRFDDLDLTQTEVSDMNRDRESTSRNHESTPELGPWTHGQRHGNPPLDSAHESDDDGNPAGGRTYGVGVAIEWQNGPLGRGEDRAEPNGAFVEDVILAAVSRLRFYQESGFSCRQNAIAITKLEEALHWLDDRSAEREERGVEGTHEL